MNNKGYYDINDSINESIKKLRNKGDEIENNIIQIIKNDNKSNTNKIMDKINFIYNYIDAKKDEERYQLEKINNQKSKELD